MLLLEMLARNKPPFDRNNREAQIVFTDEQMRENAYHKLVGVEHRELLDKMLYVTRERRIAIKSLLRMLPVNSVLDSSEYSEKLAPMFMQRLELGWTRKQDLYHFKPSYPFIPAPDRLDNDFIRAACERPMKNEFVRWMIDRVKGKKQGIKGEVASPYYEAAVNFEQATTLE